MCVSEVEDGSCVCVCVVVIIKSISIYACEFDCNFNFDYFPIHSDGHVSIVCFIVVFVVFVIDCNLNLYFQFGAMTKYVYRRESSANQADYIYILINVMVWQRFLVTFFMIVYILGLFL